MTLGIRRGRVRSPLRSIESRHGVDAPGYTPPPERPYEPEPAAPPQRAISTLGAAGSILGAALVAIAVFLPYLETPTILSEVQGNTLVQQGAWWLLAAAALIAVDSMRAYTTKTRSWGPLGLAIIAGAILAYFALNRSVRTFYHLTLSGEPVGKGFVLTPGIGVYVGAAGIALALIGGWAVLRGAPVIETTRVCPDCAETVQLNARVCKHCGLRFDEDEVPGTA